MVTVGTGIHANPSSEISQSKHDPDAYTEQQKLREYVVTWPRWTFCWKILCWKPHSIHFLLYLCVVFKFYWDLWSLGYNFTCQYFSVFEDFYYELVSWSMVILNLELQSRHDKNKQGNDKKRKPNKTGKSIPLHLILSILSLKFVDPYNNLFTYTCVCVCACVCIHECMYVCMYIS